MSKVYKSSLPVVINGAGLVGSLAAIYMRVKFNCPVIVAEKRVDIRKASAETGRSINLVLTSRGLNALQQVGLADKALQLCVNVQGRILHPVDTSAPVVFQPYGVSPKEVNYSVSRTQLNALLIDEAEKCGAVFRFQHELEHIDFSKMVATYRTPSGGAQIAGCVFFGTDGVGSMTRQLLLEQLRIDGVLAVDSMQRLGISYKELTFPAKKVNGQREYSMDHRGLHIWPRGPHFLMALADKQQTFTGTLYLPDGSANLGIPGGVGDVPTFADLGNDKEKVEAFVKAAYPDVPSIVEDYSEQLCTRDYSFLATLRTTHWAYQHKALVFGDAGHGIVPFFGQGMNAGFESLLILTRFLQQNGGFQSKEGLQRAFSEFERYHHASTDAIADMAIENFAEMSYKVGQAAFLRRKQVENAVESKFPTLFRSRYYMVTKTLIPYKLVKAAGQHTDACVDELLRQCDERKVEVDKLPDEEVVRVVNATLQKFLKPLGIDVGDPWKEYYPAATANKAKL